MIVDRRRSRLALVAASVAALPAAVCLGRGPAPDPDADLIAEVARADASLAAYWRARQAWPELRVLLFRGNWASPCGAVGEGTGPAYCPASDTVYLDPAFLRQLREPLPRAYVVAHEAGHRVARLRGQHGAPPFGAELLADCYAGAWLGDAWQRGEVPLGDLDAVLETAAEAGDDARGTPLDRWTHGSGAERARAVSIGLGGSEMCGRYVQ